MCSCQLSQKVRLTLHHSCSSLCFETFQYRHFSLKKWIILHDGSVSTLPPHNALHWWFSTDDNLHLTSLCDFSGGYLFCKMSPTNMYGDELLWLWTQAEVVSIQYVGLCLALGQPKFKLDFRRSGFMQSLTSWFYNRTNFWTQTSLGLERRPNKLGKHSILMYN